MWSSRSCSRTAAAVRCFSVRTDRLSLTVKSTENARGGRWRIFTHWCKTRRTDGTSTLLFSLQITSSIREEEFHVRREPLLKIITIEDRATKDFYRRSSSPPPPRESSPTKKSILKKERASSSSPSSRLDFHRLADVSRKTTHPHSLFQSTINIFEASVDPSQRPRRRLSRLEIYLKPYRGEPDRPAKRKKTRVSWSPVREYIPPSPSDCSVSQLRSLPVEYQLTSHEETMEHYERLLEKMRLTDEQLSSLSQTLKKKTREKPPLRTMTTTVARRPPELVAIPVKKETFSPALLQMCLIVLLLFNLLLAYFFNDINVWWSDYLLSSS